MTATTLSVLNSYVIKDEDGKIDASGILSKASYEEWLSKRKYLPKDPPHAFRKVITGHCRGDKGLAPFSQELEKALLKLLRRKTVWECFQDTPKKIGLRGFQTLGFWEAKLKQKPNCGKRKAENKSKKAAKKMCFNKSFVREELGDNRSTSSVQSQQIISQPGIQFTYNTNNFNGYGTDASLKFRNKTLSPSSQIIQQQIQNQIDVLKFSILKNIMFPPSYK